MKQKNYLRYIFIFIITTLTILASTSYAANDEAGNSLSLSAEAAIVIDADTGTVLAHKNSTKKMYPASTTKILTAIIAIEKCNLDDVVEAHQSAISQIPAGYSSAYIKDGEKLTVEELLKVFLVHSANEAGVILAEHISGSTSEFANLMNEKLKEIGATNSHFLNPSGIHNENHYTTAEDLAKIAQYCMKNKTFRDIVSMKSCTINKTNKSEKRTYKNTNELLNPSSQYYVAECVGIKTGYTTEAKNCLVSAFTKDGLSIIGVILGAPDLPSGKSSRFLDSKTLCNYTYSNFAIENLAKKGSSIKNIEIENGTDETKNLDLILERDVTMLSKIGGVDTSYEITLNNEISAPIRENDIVGTVTYTSCGLTYTTNLLASHDVEVRIDYYKIITLIFSFLFIMFVLILLLKSKKSKRRKRR